MHILYIYIYISDLSVYVKIMLASPHQAVWSFRYTFWSSRWPNWEEKGKEHVNKRKERGLPLSFLL